MYQAVTSLCWQRSNPISVNEANCSLEVALLGVTGEDSVLMPDPLPPSTSASGRTALSSFPVKPSGRSASDNSASAGMNSSSGSGTLGSNTSSEETSFLSSSVNPPLGKASFSRLQTPRNSYIIKDDMEVFSPLVDVQPITPSVSNFWDSNDDLRKDYGGDRKMAWGVAPPGGIRRFPSIDELKDDSQSPASASFQV